MARTRIWTLRSEQPTAATRVVTGNSGATWTRTRWTRTWTSPGRLALTWDELVRADEPLKEELP